MCRKQHAVQVMAHGYLASIASEVRTCIACWGKRFRKGIGQRTLFVGHARHDGFASKSANARKSQQLRHSSCKRKAYVKLVVMPAGQQWTHRRFERRADVKLVAISA